jgi:hypothetical protein
VRPFAAAIPASFTLADGGAVLLVRDGTTGVGGADALGLALEASFDVVGGIAPVVTTVVGGTGSGFEAGLDAGAMEAGVRFEIKGDALLLIVFVVAATGERAGAETGIVTLKFGATFREKGGALSLAVVLGVLLVVLLATAFLEMLVDSLAGEKPTSSVLAVCAAMVVLVALLAMASKENNGAARVLGATEADIGNASAAVGLPVVELARLESLVLDGTD